MTVTTKTGFKCIAVIAALLFVMAEVLTGCSKSDASLQEGAPKWASELTLSEWTATVINDFNEGNYQAIAGALVDSDMTAESLKEQSQETINKLGTFEAFGDTRYYTGESLGRPYSCVIQQADYENGTAEFRISFFEDGKLAGFYFFPKLADDDSDSNANANGSEAESEEAPEEVVAA